MCVEVKIRLVKQDTEIEIEVVPAPTMAEQMVGSKFLVPVMVMLQSLID